MKKLLLITTFFIISLATFAQDVDFASNYLPSPRAATSSANDGEYIYLVNGFSDTSPFTSEVYKREPNSVWNVLTDQTISKRYASAACVNGKLYVFNGKTASGTYNNQMEVIDVVTGDITLSTLNPSPARAGGVATYNNEIYSFGGSTASGVFSDNVYKFNPVTETWTFVTNMPIAAETKGEIVNGKLYIFGGYSGSGGLNSIHIYDIAGNSWSTAADLPINLSANATAVIGDVIWLVGDYSNQTFLASFDTTTLILSQRNSNMIARRHATAEGLGDDLIIMGGNTASAISSTINSVQRSNLAEHSVPTAERDALMTIYNATNGASWTNNTNWGSSYAESLWKGITVEDVDGTYHVTRIVLDNNNLNGSLPAEIGNLTELKEISITFNNLLTGAIPTEIGNLSNLEMLSFWDDDFTGTIPNEIGNCTNLHTVSFEDNQLTGNIPTSLSNLTAMRSFWVNGNNLSGDVPDFFSNWADLVYLSIGNANYTAGVNNDFTGTLDLSSNLLLKLCWVDNTNITTLNVKNGNNTNMQNSFFNTTNTPNLSCIIVDDITYSTNTWTNIDSTATFLESEEACTTLQAQSPALMAIYNATDGANWTNNTNWNTANPISTWYGVTVENGLVTSLELYNNNLTGTIPIEIGDLEALTTLDLFTNNLTGEIPAEIWTLSKLKNLWLGSQASSSSYEPGTLTLSSGIPASIANLQDLEWLNLNGIYLEQPLQPELFNLPVLDKLRLQDCGITGTLPAEFSTVNDLRIERNEFEGTIPSEILNSIGNALLGLTGNYFNFTDLEPLVQAGNITNLDYSPQRTRDIEEDEAYIPGTDVTLTLEEGEGTRETSDNNVYQWFKDEIAITGANQDTYTIYNAQTTDSGVYYCEITNPLLPDMLIVRANINLTIDPSASVNDVFSSSIVIYPNPVIAVLYIKTTDDTNISSVAIYDTMGKLVLKTDKTSIDMQAMATGVYILKITNNKGNVARKRVVKD